MNQSTIKFLIFNLIFFLFFALVFFFSEVNDHMLFFVNLTQSGGALRYEKFASSHLLIHGYLDFLYSAGFSGVSLINFLKALVFSSFYISALLLFKRSIWAFSFLLFPPIWYLLLIFEDNLIYFPILIIWFDLLFNQKDRRSPAIAVALGLLLGISVLINAINSIFLFFLIGLIFTEGIFKKDRVNSLFWLTSSLSFCFFSFALVFPFIESYQFHPFMEVFPKVFRLERGITIGVTELSYLEALKSSMLKMTPYYWSTGICLLISLGLFLFKIKNLSFAFCTSAFLFFALYVEPDSPERYDYFFTICFVANLNSFDKRSKVIAFALLGFIVINTFTGIEYYKRNNEKWTLYNGLDPQTQEAYIPFRLKDVLPSFSAYLPNATKNTYLYLINKKGQCEYLEQSPELFGFWEMTPTPTRNETQCLSPGYKNKVLILK